MASALSIAGPGGFLGSSGQSSSKMTDSTCSLTDFTLEQASIKLQEIEKENIALKDNLRTHNAIVKKQYDALAEWRKKETDKFEQTKALITALRAENQELQVKVMTYADKEKEQAQCIQAYDEEKARLLRQKAMSDQRLFNVYRMAEEQGVRGLAQEELGEAQDVQDSVILVASVEKEELISKLEATVSSKEELIAQLRAEILKKDQEVVKFRDTTRQLLKDMESQQRLKESIEDENRMLTKQIMQAEQMLHKQMQEVMATTKREMQVEQMISSTSSLDPGSVTASSSAGSATTRPRLANGDPSNTFSFPENMEDLVGIAKSLEAKQKEELTTDLLKQTLNDERKDKKVMQDQIEKLQKQLQELNMKQEERQQELEQVQQTAAETAERLAQDYEQKLMDVAKNNSSKPIQASDTEDMSILRSQVLALLREVDEAQNKLSAAVAALHLKDTKIMELDQLNQSVRKEYNDYWQESQALIQNLRTEVSQQFKSKQENSFIKKQHEKLQDSFSTLVTDYKELQETFEAYRVQMERQAPKRIRKETMEEINRLTAQVIAADEAIALRDEELAKLKNDLKNNPQQEEKIQLLMVQAEVYKSDFMAEREARNKLAEEKNTLTEENARLLQQCHMLQDKYRSIAEELEGHNRKQINEMQRRFRASTGHLEWAPGLRATPPLAQDYRHQMQEYGHQMPDYVNQAPDYMHPAQDYRPHPQDYRYPTQDYRDPHQQPVVGAGRAQGAGGSQSVPVQQGEEELQSFQDYECPSCAAHFPDIDTLQLHVPECIDNNR